MAPWEVEGVPYSRERCFRSQMQWDRSARVYKHFVFRQLDLRVSVQAGWDCECSVVRGNELLSYPEWIRSVPNAWLRDLPFFEDPVVSYEVAIMSGAAVMDFDPAYRSPAGLDIGLPGVDKWKDGEVGNKIPFDAVQLLLDELAAREVRRTLFYDTPRIDGGAFELAAICRRRYRIAVGNAAIQSAFLS